MTIHLAQTDSRAVARRHSRPPQRMLRPTALVVTENTDPEQPARQRLEHERGLDIGVGAVRPFVSKRDRMCVSLSE